MWSAKTKNFLIGCSCFLACSIHYNCSWLLHGIYILNLDYCIHYCALKFHNKMKKEKIFPWPSSPNPNAWYLYYNVQMG
jgi:hypothetical protein